MMLEIRLLRWIKRAPRRLKPNYLSSWKGTIFECVPLKTRESVRVWLLSRCHRAGRLAAPG